MSGATGSPSSRFDVVVVGGGHAGAEAAVAAARALGAGARVALVTSALDTIGQLSCNPAIGGIAKGTVVREIDALGGVMGRATDMASIQFRMLNRGKGPAVWAPRAQCDRILYREAVRGLLNAHAGVTLVEGTVRRLLLERAGARVCGVETMAGERLRARCIVITTGTFLRGRMHIGVHTQISGGRAGEAASTDLAEQIAGLGIVTSRFKTGTPPRIAGETVNCAVLQRQESEIADFDYQWSAFWSAPHILNRLEQAPCWITFAGAATKDIVATHLGESAMYGGAIAARGPRYCPSIEDKILRFPNAERHQIFLEPEGLGTSEMYVNGLSTSLPADVQLRMLRSVPGLQRVQMTRPGYAIEYDYCPPTQLLPWLEVRVISGLFLAGQINGTTGYEEAGAQGVVAGLNAALRAMDRDPVTFGRESSYIGVLCDDLVTRGVDEPYRLFTSRSEFRLSVRQDNALKRLSALAQSLGLYDAHEQAVVNRRVQDEDRVMQLARTTQARGEHVDEQLKAAGTAPLAQPVRVASLVKRQGTSLAALFAATGVTEALSREAIISVELELKYAGYFAKEHRAADRLRRMARYPLHPETPYERMLTLSMESRQKLAARRPLSLAQAASVPGVSPADLQNLILEIERSRS